MLSNMLRSIDFFGEPVKVFLNRRSTITTELGGILTIITSLILVILSWYIGNDIIYKENPFSFSQTTLYKNFQTTYIDNTNFPMSFALLDFNGNPIEQKGYFNVTLLLLNFTISKWYNGDN